tara:strand:+ start:1056 stop:1532 length:477 start_codon:yes stop_codon:yes gene_type:complete
MIIKIALLLTLFLIFIQDIKDRQVYWFLFPISGFLFGMLHYFEVGMYQFLIHLFLNLFFMGIVLGFLCYYSYFKLRKRFFQTFGSGDLLLFLAICFSFETGTFLILFSFSLLFSLILYYFMNSIQTDSTIPLAGNISFFFAIVIGLSWSGLCESLYLI